MHRVEEISLLRDQVEAVEADRDRWRRYAGTLRDRLAATQDAVRKWHHHAHCRDSYNGRIGEELRDLAGERDALKQQLAESEQQLRLWVEADNANREQLAEAEAGVMRRALEFYARAETYHVIGPNDGRRPIWEDTGEMARAALASGAGEKAGAVLAAAVSCAQAEERLEAAARARGPDIGPESHRAYVERLNLRNAVKLLLGDAVAAMEGKGDE